VAARTRRIERASIDVGRARERDSLDRWRQASMGTRPDDEVFIVRQNEDNATSSRLATGATGDPAASRRGNLPPLTATAPARRSRQPIPSPRSRGLSPVCAQVFNPVAAGGGSDADCPTDLRQQRAHKQPPLGRAVSLADFEALARRLAGCKTRRLTGRGMAPCSAPS